MYPALTAIVGVLLADAAVHREDIGRWIALGSHVAGVFFVAASVAAFAVLALLSLHPGVVERILAGAGIHVAQITTNLRAEVSSHFLFAVLIPLFTAAVGGYLVTAEASAERMVAGIAGAFVAIVLAASVIVEPAIANALSLKDFAARAMRIAGTESLGYFGSIDYGFAYYCGRNLRMISPRNPDAPALIVAPEHDWNLLSDEVRKRFNVIMTSNPTDSDGGGRMLLLRRAKDAAPASHVWSL
jgi:hypothetical protein